jgi:ferric-dicitrate binding protein FerR (iron transport regulator)
VSLMESKSTRKSASESALRFPLKEQLDESRIHLGLERSWMAIEGRLSRAERASSFDVVQRIGAWIRTDQRRSVGWGAGFALVLVLALLGSSALRWFNGEGATSTGLLVAGGGSEVRLRVEPGEAQKVVRFQDDSAVELKKGFLESIESNSSRLTLRLSHGSARFSVTPGGRRTWTVKTDFAEVEVVGTVFQVAADGAALAVVVERGVVVVRSSSIDGGQRRLTAGG